MNDRIGNIEETLHELKAMVFNIAKFTTTDFINLHAKIPRSVCTEIDTNFLKRIIKAVEKTRHFKVKTAWIIIYKVNYTLYHQFSIYMQLKEHVVISSMSEEILQHLSGELSVHSSHFEPCQPCSLAAFQNIQSRCIDAPKVIRVDVATDGSS